MTAPVVPAAPVVTSATGIVLPPLPQWNDAESVTSYLVSMIAFALGVVGMLHPGFTEPSWAVTLIPIVGTLVAGCVQAVHVITHRSATKAVHVAAINGRANA